MSINEFKKILSDPETSEEMISKSFSKLLGKLETVQIKDLLEALEYLRIYRNVLFNDSIKFFLKSCSEKQLNETFAKLNNNDNVGRYGVQYMVLFNEILYDINPQKAKLIDKLYSLETKKAFQRILESDAYTNKVQ
jgi:hypothetical protein